VRIGNACILDLLLNQTERAMIDLHYWPTPNGKKVTILL
jgi:hypothetical protein